MSELIIWRFIFVKIFSKNIKIKLKWIFKVCIDYYRKLIILVCYVVNEN